MKVQIEIDCTPEEARDFMGLPDMSKANGIYVDTMANAMKGVTSPDQLQEFMQYMTPMGQVGIKLFQNFVENSMKAGAAAAGMGKKSKD